MNYKKLFLLIIVLIALLGACDSQDDDEIGVTATSPPIPSSTPTELPPKPTVVVTSMPETILAPMVIQRYPQRGQKHAAHDVVELTFDQSMNRDSIEDAFEMLHASDEPTTIDGEINWVDDRTMHFKPEQPLARASTYDVILTQHATTNTGMPLRQPYTFRFETIGFLEVSQVIPAPDTTEIETDSTITVMFNRPVVPLTTLNKMEDLPHPLVFEPETEGTGEWLNTSIYIFTPSQPLAGGTNYTVKVMTNGDTPLQAIDGAILQDDFTWQFSTIPPQILSVHPQPDSEQVGIESTIIVYFNQPIDPESAQDLFSLTTGGQTIEGKFYVDNNPTPKPIEMREFGAIYWAEASRPNLLSSSTLTFTPTNPLDFKTTYQVRIESSVKSLSGGEGMRESFTSQFTTVPLPKILTTNPHDGEQKVNPHTDFSIEFNTRIDPTTVMDNITFTPPLSPAQVYTSSWRNEFSIYFSPKPDEYYVVEIDDGIADPYGNTIPRGKTVRFRTDDLPAEYRLHVPSFVATYNASQPIRIPVQHTNIDVLILELYQIDPLLLTQRNWRWDDDVPIGASLIRTMQESLEAPDNQREMTMLDLNLLEPGFYLLETDSPDIDEGYYGNHRHVLMVSDLNLTMKTSPDEILLWATALENGQPVVDLSIMIVEFNDSDSVGKNVQTDNEGIAISKRNPDYESVIAFSESPFVAISQDWKRGLNRRDFGVVEGLPYQDFRLHVDTDRPIYRPGQTVNFKGVVRVDDDSIFSLPKQGTVQVIINSSYGDDLYDEMLPLTELGTFNGMLELAPDVNLGQYQIRVSSDSGQYYGSGSFQVAAYRPPEFEVAVDTLSEIIRSDDFTATIHAKYFFGGALANASVEWNIMAESYTFEPAWGGRYNFNDSNSPYPYFGFWFGGTPSPEPILSGTGMTDSSGKIMLDIEADELAAALDSMSPMTGSLRLTVEANVTGPDNQVISGRNSLIAHAGDFYIGLSPQTYIGTVGDKIGTDVIAVDWHGKRLADIPIEIEIYRREWENIFIEYDNGGGHWQSKENNQFVESLTVTSDELGEAVASFTPENGGTYRIVAMPSKSDSPSTSQIRSSVFIWVTGNDTISWQRENHDRINLISDKNTYDVGDTAEILIPSPFDGEQIALITVERGKIIRHEVISFEGSSYVYELLITEQDVPNIYVSVVLVKGRANESHADFKMGLLPLEISQDTKRLSIEIKADVETAEPNTAVNYTITVLRPDGQPARNAELSLDVVDKAILTMQPRSKNIMSTLYAQRSLEVETSMGLNVSANRYLEDVIEEEEITNVQRLEASDIVFAFGALDGESKVAFQVMASQRFAMYLQMPMGKALALPPGVEIRQEFADTAYWNPIIITDENGQATVNFTLPDNLTTWVVRGVGLTGDTIVGTETSDLISTKPLLIRPVAPRFFVVNDKAELSANVSNNTNADLEIKVGLDAEGVMLADDTPAVQTVVIPAHAETAVSWHVAVKDVTDVSLVFSAISGDYADASKPRLTTGPDGTLLVYRYTTPDIVGTAGQITEEGMRIEGVALPPRIGTKKALDEGGYDERQGSLTIQVDPSLAAGMRDGLTYLEHYEYECTEQTVSRFLPNVLTHHALQSLGIRDPELAERLPELVETALEKLYREQNPDGGWGWWQDHKEWKSNIHVSGYVVFALIKAEKAGIEIEPAVLTQGLDYLSMQAKKMKTTFSRWEGNRQAWLLYVLAEGDLFMTDHVDTMFENRELLSHYARAYLAQAIWLNDADDPRLKTLLSDLNNEAVMSATGVHWEEAFYDWWAMNTDTRSTAIILDTLAKLDPDNELIPNVVRWLMIARKDGIWETTQETAWSLISLTTWMMETGELDADYEFGVFLNENEQTRRIVTSDTIQDSTKIVIPIAELIADSTNALTFARSDGNGRLYYSAHLKIYQPVEMVEPADRGIVVSRRYTLASCEGAECPDVTEIHVGDVVRVDLTIIAPNDLYYLLVEDPLPAGGEAIDTGLATTSLLAMDPSLRREDSRYWWWWRWYSRSELRDEKVVLFADYLRKGTYEYSYTFRATLPGEFHVIPTVAQEFYFPEVFGRSNGRLLTIEK